MMVESAPAPAFVVTKAEVLFQVLVIALNTPTHFGHEHQLFYQRFGWCRGQEVFGWLRFALRPLNQQPLFVTQGAAPIVSMRRANPHGRKSR
ncbi:hypothetical protein D9M69_603530 [compost metagenome]